MSGLDLRRKPVCSRNWTPVVIGAVVATIAVALVGASGGQAKNDSQPPSLQHDLDALVSAGAPGVVLFARTGTRTVEVASGLGDVEKGRPLQVRDRFRIGSLTKTYVATVVLQLVGEGKLGLDDSVERWLPGLVPNGRKVTIRQLLNHSSGIPDFDQDPRVLKPYLSGNLGYYWPPRRLVAIALSHKPLFRPGARYSYSNTNYLLAGLIVEAATGHHLALELERRIFRPLRLEATSFPTTPVIAGRHAHGYYVLGKPPATDITGLSPYAWAAGAVVSTGAEVASFYRALLAGRLLRPLELKQMTTTLGEGANSDLPGSRYGLGLERYRLPCGAAWGHGGNFPGYLVYALTSTDGKRQTVILINEDPSSLPKRAQPLFFSLLEKAYCR